MERIQGLLQHSGRDSADRIAAATLATIQSVIHERLPDDAPFLRPISIQRGTVRIRALHSAAAGHINIRAQEILNEANTVLQRRFPGTTKLSSLTIIRH